MTTKKSRKTPAADVQFNMQVAVPEIDLSADDAALAAFLADDGFDEELAAPPEVVEIDIDDEASIEAAIAELDAPSIYDDQPAPEAISAADAPLTEPDAIDKKVKGKGKKTAAPKVAKEPKAPKAPKEPAAPRVTYIGNDPSIVLANRLGADMGEMLLLEAGDIELDADAIAAKQTELMALMDVRPKAERGTGPSDGPTTQKKVAEKIVMLFGWMKKGGSLNEVMRRTFSVLARDGFITSGAKGNLHAELLSKPYSDGTCRAQAGQMYEMLPMLKIATLSEKGKFVLNPESLIFMKAKAELGL